MSEINVTPLVDVMLVLLIIFMVTAPLMTVGVPVDLPKTDAARLTDQVEPLTVSIDKKGKIFIQETETALEDLSARLTTVTQNNLETKIFIRGDETLEYGHIMEVMGAISAAGFAKVALLAEIPMAPKKKSS
mgnify:CR=1 FL=1